MAISSLYLDSITPVVKNYITIELRNSQTKLSLRLSLEDSEVVTYL